MASRLRLSAPILPLAGLLCAVLAGTSLARACIGANCGDSGAKRPGETLHKPLPLYVILSPGGGGVCDARPRQGAATSRQGAAESATRGQNTKDLREAILKNPLEQNFPGANHSAIIMLADASPAGTAATGSDDRAAAEEIFTSRCVACHGPDGRGDGPAAGSLKPRPINFHDLKWQKSTSDETIAKAIVEGGAAVGISKQMMPNPDLEDQPGTVNALIARIRAFGR